jgi:hypothetical protein
MPKSTAATLSLLVLLAQPSSAQCVSSLRDELWALDDIAKAIEERTFSSGAEGAAVELKAGVSDSTKKPTVVTNAQRWKLFSDALGDDALYLGKLARAGVAMPCLMDKRDVFRTAARAKMLELLGGKQDAFDEKKREALAEALRTGAATVLETRYASSDRFGMFFGVGASYIPQRDDAVRYKVISQSETVVTPGTNGQPATEKTQTRQYIVEETSSRSYPVGATGLTMRFRDRNSGRGQGCFKLTGEGDVARKAWHSASECVVWLAERAWPTAVFGSVQFGGGEGVVTGTTLGAGWKVVGDVNLLVGFGISRLPTLRRDLLTEFEASKNGRLLLPAGENEESIMGKQSEQTWLVAIGIPLALRNAFGGK